MGKIQTLPFDLYQRYKFTRELAESVRKKNRMKILDVGGHPGVIGDFFPKDETFLIDLKIVKRENFIKADCEFLPFKNEIFDLTVNLDVLEHIPKEKRIPTLGELVRVSKTFLIVGAPFDSEEVRKADNTSLQYVMNVLGKWMKILKSMHFMVYQVLMTLKVFLIAKNLVTNVFLMVS
jgi:hypothetical protein